MLTQSKFDGRVELITVTDGEASVERVVLHRETLMVRTAAGGRVPHTYLAVMDRGTGALQLLTHDASGLTDGLHDLADVLAVARCACRGDDGGPVNRTLNVLAAAVLVLVPPLDHLARAEAAAAANGPAP